MHLGFDPPPSTVDRSRSYGFFLKCFPIYTYIHCIVWLYWVLCHMWSCWRWGSKKAMTQTALNACDDTSNCFDCLSLSLSLPTAHMCFTWQGRSKNSPGLVLWLVHKFALLKSFYHLAPAPAYIQVELWFNKGWTHIHHTRTYFLAFYYIIYQNSHIILL